MEPRTLRELAERHPDSAPVASSDRNHRAVEVTPTRQKAAKTLVPRWLADYSTALRSSHGAIVHGPSRQVRLNLGDLRAPVDHDQFVHGSIVRGG
jgi:hypothetical protein